jgi:hypothetical protein
VRASPHELLLGPQVLCIMAYERTSAAPLYRYQGVLVAADHPVLHAGRWMHAAAAPGAQPVEPAEAAAAGSVLYDLVTSDHRIYVAGGACFSDYDEVRRPPRRDKRSVACESLRAVTRAADLGEMRCRGAGRRKGRMPTLMLGRGLL